jgi:hypothetical protein
LKLTAEWAWRSHFFHGAWRCPFLWYALIYS